MSTKSFPVRDYDLDATLDSGQAFRWRRNGKGWNGVIGTRWVQLRGERNAILAETAETTPDWLWLSHYLQLPLLLEDVLKTFPADEPMQQAVGACRGLRLLRQEPWECLASFILSSTKQIVQIREIIALLCERYGEPIITPAGAAPAFAFPKPARLAAVPEAELRGCKMGFRAPYLLEAAQRIAAGQLDLAKLGSLPLEPARAQLMELPGVGRKVADCVLLFAYGFSLAFPVDVWVMKGLRELYFRRRRASMKRLHEFAANHFGPNAGYAQQYLFHYMRMKAKPQTSNPKLQTPQSNTQSLEAAGRTPGRGHRQTNLEVLFTPADFGALKQRDLSETVCVVFDVLRATSTMVTGLANGAAAFIPVAEIAEALALRQKRREVLLAGERDGVRISAKLTGSVAFDLGNSPREFASERIKGRTIVTTTTNGTRALRACLPARAVLLGAFLNLQATAQWLESERPRTLLLVCSGTHEETAYEDVLGAGALCELLWAAYRGGAVADSSHIARRLYHLEQSNLLAAAEHSRNGRRLMALPELREDVAFCVQRDISPLVARMNEDGQVTAIG